jgi:hypothetical protein
MSEGSGRTASEDEPFAGNGPRNLNPQMLQQAWGLTKILEYQRRVRVLTEQLRKREMEMDR